MKLDKQKGQISFIWRYYLYYRVFEVCFAKDGQLGLILGRDKLCHELELVRGRESVIHPMLQINSPDEPFVSTWWDLIVYRVDCS